MLSGVKRSEGSARAGGPISKMVHCAAGRRLLPFGGRPWVLGTWSCLHVFAECPHEWPLPPHRDPREHSVSCSVLCCLVSQVTVSLCHIPCVGCEPLRLILPLERRGIKDVGTYFNKDVTIKNKMTK